MALGQAVVSTVAKPAGSLPIAAGGARTACRIGTEATADPRGARSAPGRGRPRPAWGVVLAAALAVAASTIPVLASWFVYDRAAVDAGEAWRLVTGHLVHFSVRHLGIDAASLVVLAFLAWRWSIPQLDQVCLLAAMASGLAVHFGAAHFAYFGGLSGVVVGAWVHVGLQLQMRGSRSERILGSAALALAAIKLVAEVLTDVSISAGASAPYVLATASHVAGAGAAMVHALFIRFRASRSY